MTEISATKYKHPKELYRLSFAVSWGMFSYYGTTALLIAYIVTQLHFKESEGYGMLGTFSALTFGLPLFCGAVADRILGKRKALIWGCVLHFIGLCCVAMPYNFTFFIGLAIFAVGSGFVNGMFKALCGDFYKTEDTHGKDAGYTILYGLFNVGVAAGAMICGYVGQVINWRLGFAVAAFGALLSLLSMWFGIGREYGQPSDIEKMNKKIITGISTEAMVYLLTLPAIGLVTLVFLHPAVMDVILMPLLIVAFGYTIFISFKYTKAERLKIFAALIAFIAIYYF